MTSAPSPDDDQYSVATSEENREKNRYSNKLPSKLHQIILFITYFSACIIKIMFWADNFYRVCLKSTPSSDYINASFIDVRLRLLG